MQFLYKNFEEFFGEFWRITEFDASHLVLEFKRLIAEIDLRNFYHFCYFILLYL